VPHGRALGEGAVLLDVAVDHRGCRGDAGGHPCRRLHGGW